MAWIKEIPPEFAEGLLNEIYDDIAGARKGIAELHVALSLFPEALKGFWEFYKAFMFCQEGIGRLNRERLGVLISASNSCAYGLRHHGESLRQLGETAENRLEFEAGRIPVNLPEGERALLRWAEKAARTPEACSEEDVELLRAYGFDDRAILDGTLTIAFFSFINRIALLLGVTLEPGFGSTCGALGITAEEEAHTKAPKHQEE